MTGRIRWFVLLLVLFIWLATSGIADACAGRRAARVSERRAYRHGTVVSVKVTTMAAPGCPAQKCPLPPPTTLPPKK